MEKYYKKTKFTRRRSIKKEKQEKENRRGWRSERIKPKAKKRNLWKYFWHEKNLRIDKRKT